MLGLGLEIYKKSGDFIPSLKNTVAPVVSGDLNFGNVLTTTTGTWTGVGTITYAYQWQRNGIDIGGETNNTYTTVAGDIADSIKCVVTATDDVGSASKNSNTVVIIEPVAVNTVAPVVSGITYNGQTMTSSSGTWTSETTPTFTYQWQSSTDGISFSNIASANSSTYVVTPITEGLDIRCQVTATNAGGGVSENSNAIENYIFRDDTGGISSWDPTDTSQITQSGGSVSIVADKIGSVNLEQGSAPAQPTTLTHSLNGLNVLYGSGDKFMETAAASGISSSGDFSIFGVMRFDTIDNIFDGCISVGDNGGATANSFQFRAGSASQFDGALDSTSLGIAPIILTGGPFDGPSIYNVVGDFTAGTISVYIDGILRGSDSNYTTKISAIEPIRIFANRSSSNPVGIFAETGHTESVDTTTRQKIEGYLAHKFNTTGKLDAGHPYKTNAPTA